MKLNIAICDDEQIVGELIKEQLISFRASYDVDIYTSGFQLINSKKKYDIVFLDIEMPEMDGMKTAKLLREHDNNEYIIFLTSHTEFMPEAFKVKAFRFLNKPIDKLKFKEAVVEAEKEILSDEKISVSLKGEIILVNLKDIIYFEAFGDGTYIYTKQKVIESKKPLKYWIERMGSEHFFQTHKSYFVSFQYIKNIETSEVYMHQVNQAIPISRRKNTQFKNAFFEYVKKNARLI